MTGRNASVVALRRVTWLILAGCILLVALLVTLDAPRGRPAVLAAVLVVSAVAGHLFAVGVLGVRTLSTPVMAALVAVAALAAGGILVESRMRDVGGYPAALPVAELIAAVWAGCGWPRRRIAAAGIGLPIAASAGASALTGTPPWGPILIDTAITVMAALGLYAQVIFLVVAERLDQARRLERVAAVSDERLRFAADLHDIQGHSLQVIALKSELAQRLTPTDPARAAAEMRDVQELARKALGDTRKVVQGYRAVSLDTEITNATRVLAAAGIAASLSRPEDPPALPSPVEKLFGLVVRECTTNVLRHSAASRCDVALTVEDGGVRLRFSNDAPLDAPAGPAGGLAGLAERLAAEGGRLVTRGTADAFTVDAHLPVPASS
jgi:two-component system sensor histidine kinase DesK